MLVHALGHFGMLLGMRMSSKDKKHSFQAKRCQMEKCLVC